MNRTLLAVTLFFTVTLLHAYSSAQEAKPDPAAAKHEQELAEAGEKLVDRVCGECHNVDEITSRRTAKEWSDTVTSMADRGAIATDEEFTTIKRYLGRYFGIVRLNSATAEELSAVLGLSPRDAQAVVEHRKKNGRFVDAAALLKVAGVDKAKIEEQPQALRFD